MNSPVASDRTLYGESSGSGGDIGSPFKSIAAIENKGPLSNNLLSRSNPEHLDRLDQVDKSNESESIASSQSQHSEVNHSSHDNDATHRHIRNDVYNLIDDAVDVVVDDLESRIESVEGRLLGAKTPGNMNSNGSGSGSGSNNNTPRILGPRDVARHTEDRFEDTISNEVSPLLERIENPIFGRPEDPRYSPLNLLSVRALRIILFILALLWSAWIIVLIVNIFTQFPWLVGDTKSAVYMQLDMACMSLAAVISSLVFYKFPGKTDRNVGYFTAGIVLVDLIVVISVPSQRKKNGSRGGLVTTIGSLITFILAPATDKVVEWAQSHERALEDGPNSSPRPRSLTELINMTLIFSMRVLILASVALISTNMVVESHDFANLPPPGILVPVPVSSSSLSSSMTNYSVNDGPDYTDFINVHIYCTHFNRSCDSNIADIDTSGKFQQQKFCLDDSQNNKKVDNNLTILIEAGESSAYDFSSWVMDLYSLGEVSQVCYWDRPGFGFSESVASPISAGMISGILSTVLDMTRNTPSPQYVLVSHGIGGIYSRIFASHHSDQIHSIMLIDSLHEDLFYRQSSPWQGMKYFLEGVISPFGFRNLAGLIFLGEGPRDRFCGPAQQYQPSYLYSKLQEQLSARGSTKVEIIKSNKEIAEDIPVLVVSSAESIRDDVEWSDKQRQLTKLTGNTLAWEILNGPHDLWRNRHSRKQLQQLLLDLIYYGKRK